MNISVIDGLANRWTFTTRMAGPEDGPPVILLHGFPQTSRCFSSQLLAVGEAGFRAVAPDQRGYSPGARPTGVDDYLVDNLASDIAALADALAFDTFDLVGHDWGGLVAWTVAGLHPQRVRTRTSVSTPHPRALAAALVGRDPDHAQRSSYLDLFRQPDVSERLLFGEDGRGDGLRQLFADSGIEGGVALSYVETMRQPGTLTAALNWYGANDLRAPAGSGSITVPTMYVWSAADIALGRWAAEATAGYVDEPYRFEELEGVNHWIPDVAPDRLNLVLLEHLGRSG